MNPFTPLCFIDVWAFSASLRSRLALFDPDAPWSHIIVRDPDGRYHKALKEWKALAQLLDRLRKLPLVESHVFGEIGLHQLKPGAAEPWRPRQSEWQRAHLVIVTNPLAFTFCGIAAQALPIGMLTMVDASAPCCAVNWGETSCFYLTVAFASRRKEWSGIEEIAGEAVPL
jgi:hypothetical protein